MGIAVTNIRYSLAWILVFLIAAEPAIWGCSPTSSPSDTEEIVQTVNTEGSVDESVIGGVHLQVISAWDDPQTIDEDSGFNITVSAEGVQLLMVQDESSEMRALALSVPGQRSGEFEDLVLDVESTLLSLLMMTPGILTVDPEGARQRRSELEALPEYQSALVLLEEQLPSHSLPELLEMSPVNDALETCVMAWASRHAGGANPRGLLHRDSGFSAFIQDYTDPSNTEVRLVNQAWRFLNVYRRDLSVQGQELGVVEVADGVYSMGGATTASWGSLFMETAGSPSVEIDEVDFSEVSDISRSEYWATGLGWGPEGSTLPGSADGDCDDAKILTLTWYLAFPLIDLILGAGHLLELGKEGLSIAWSVIGGLIDTSGLNEANSPEEIAAACINVLASIVTILATAGVLGISAPAWVIVAAVLAGAGMGVAAANVVLAVDSWLEVPQVTMEAVANPLSNEIVVIAPTSSTVWFHGQTGCAVEWIPTSAGTIHADLMKDGKAIDIFYEWTENDGYLVRTLPIPEHWGTGTGFQIRMWDEESNSGMSEFFEIRENLSSPEGFVYIPDGRFLMGAPSDESGAQYDEFPQHNVVLTRAFHLQATVVNNQQYAELAQWAYEQGYCTITSGSLRDDLDGSTRELLKLNYSNCEISFSGGFFIVDSGLENHPVKEVTWYGSAAYCDWLSLQVGLPRAYDHGTWQCNGNSPYTAMGYRLPTEAEWEYACRAETATPFNTGNCLDAGTEANYNGNYPYTSCPSGLHVGWTVPVGSYPANAWSLYDMHGNIWEWCNDWYSDSYYSSSPSADPVGPLNGSRRVARGGDSNDSASGCRSTARRLATYGSAYIGFRPARSAF
jgi:formylglycine-generating enzyme required for sulfatase activity